MFLVFLSSLLLSCLLLIWLLVNYCDLNHQVYWSALADLLRAKTEILCSLSVVFFCCSWLSWNLIVHMVCRGNLMCHVSDDRLCLFCPLEKRIQVNIEKRNNTVWSRIRETIESWRLVLLCVCEHGSVCSVQAWLVTEGLKPSCLLHLSTQLVIMTC